MGKKYKFDLTISIVTYNSKGAIEKCLDSIAHNHDDLNLQVVVGDNASTDGTAQSIRKSFPWVDVIANSENLFYTAANNQIFKFCKSRYFLILNADIIVRSGVLKSMVNYLDEHPESGGLGGCALTPSGEIDTPSWHYLRWYDFFRGAFPFPKLFHTNVLRPYNFQIDSKPLDVDVCTDACLMVRSSLFASFGGYDEHLLLYGTEDDLCHRIKTSGYYVRLMPTAHFVHQRNYSTSQLPKKFKQKLIINDTCTYFLIYRSFLEYLLVKIIMISEFHLVNLLRAIIGRKN